MVTNPFRRADVTLQFRVVRSFTSARAFRPTPRLATLARAFAASSSTVCAQTDLQSERCNQ